MQQPPVMCKYVFIHVEILQLWHPLVPNLKIDYIKFYYCIIWSYAVGLNKLLNNQSTCWSISASMTFVWHYCNAIKRSPGPWLNIKMSSYQYRKSHCGDKTVIRSSYLHNGISYTGKMISFYQISPLVVFVTGRFGFSQLWYNLMVATGWLSPQTDFNFLDLLSYLLCIISFKYDYVFI